MPIEHLDRIFQPRSVAVVGASDNPASVGFAVLRNMLASADAGTFSGAVYPVNPKRDQVQGRPAYQSLAALPEVPDLVAICTPAGTVQSLLAEAGGLGVKGVVVISAGFREAGPEGLAMEEALMAEAKKYPGMRIIGPNCLGVIVPGLGLNASFTASAPGDGQVAFISQSGALGTSILDWAAQSGVGLSHFVSVGNMMDVHFADLIDYFGQDPKTKALLLYIESIQDARAFVSAARAFSRTKPIIAYKAGRFAASAQAAASHTGAMVGADDVHDAAFRRAGIERVYSIDDLFDCAELLSRQSSPKHGRLGIVTNAGGPGVMATDALIAADGELADLAPETLDALNKALPSCWSHGNPVDVLGDATAERYAQATKLVLNDPNTDAVLIILTPQAMTDPTATAKAVIDATRETSKPVLTAWLGGASVVEGRQMLAEAGLPTYPSPERAIRGLMHLISHARTIEDLYETPQATSADMGPAEQGDSVFTRSILSQPNTLLSEVQAKDLLDHYGVPVAKAVRAHDAREAVRHAEEIGYPVAMKILSSDISHKSDAGGVMLNLTDAQQVTDGFKQITSLAQQAYPDATIDGVAVQPFVKPKHAVELILGAKKDPVFGTVLMLGLGGTTAEVWKDTVLALPPLTERLARQMLESLRAWPLLDGYRGNPRVDVDALIETIIRFSYMLTDSPNLSEFDINPLFVSPTGVVAVDARAVTDDTPVEHDPRFGHLAIRPYPAEYRDTVELADGTTITLRPIHPADEPMWHTMLASCSPETLRARFFATIKGTTHEMATCYCFNDYDREMAIVAIHETEQETQMLGVGRLVADPGREQAEYAVLVADAWQGRRIGSILTGYCLEVAREWGVSEVTASTTPENQRMLATFREHGFTMQEDLQGGLVLAQAHPQTSNKQPLGAG